MSEYNLNDVSFDFKGAYIETADEIHLFLQRQGVSQTLNCGHPLFFAEIGDYPNGGYSAEVHYSNDSEIYKGGKHGQIYKTEYCFGHGGKNAALRFIIKHASKLSGKTVTIDEQTLSYVHGWQSYDYQKADLFLSPTFYCEYSDTVRHSVTNVCLVHFESGKFSQPGLDMDAAATKYREHIDKALSDGFHACDTKRGDDYCKRRLAWLLGVYLASAGSRPRFCNLDMTIVKPSQTVKAA